MIQLRHGDLIVELPFGKVKISVSADFDTNGNKFNEIIIEKNDGVILDGDSQNLLIQKPEVIEGQCRMCKNKTTDDSLACEDHLDEGITSNEVDLYFGGDCPNCSGQGTIDSHYDDEEYLITECFECNYRLG